MTSVCRCAFKHSFIHYFQAWATQNIPRLLFIFSLAALGNQPPYSQRYSPESDGLWLNMCQMLHTAFSIDMLIRLRYSFLSGIIYLTWWKVGPIHARGVSLSDPAVSTSNSCTKSVGGQSGNSTRPHARLPPSYFDEWMTWQLNVALIRKLRGPLVCLLISDMLSTGVCTTRDSQTSGRLVHEFNCCNVKGNVQGY